MSSIRLVAWTICALLSFSVSFGQPGTPANSVFGYPGAGVIQAGDLWESFLPQGFTANYNESGSAATLGTRTFLRMGNFDRGWTSPVGHWPAAYHVTPYWFKNAMVFLYDSSPTFNPAMIGGTANPSYFDVARPTGSTSPWSNFAQLTYKSTVVGASSTTRKYSVEPWWVDGQRRQHQVYEAAWPTNAGIDVKMRAHGFAAPNWNNLNDFVIVEIELKNTGVVDMNMDGIAEQLSHDIQALAFQVSGEAFMSASTYGSGSRTTDIISSVIARQVGWIDDLDETGAPWAFAFYRAAPTTINPTAGNWDHGFNGGITKGYTDIYAGWVMIDAKSGGLPADPAQSTSGLPSKLTIFGTHPIGTGAQRGWYVSGQTTRFGHSITNPRQMFYATTSAFYVDCGKTFSTTNFDLYNLAPNANGFTGGTAGDVLSFVPKPQPWSQRPNGSMQTSGVFDQISTENGKADALTNYPSGFGTFSIGASHTENFDGDAYSGIGPFSLKTDSVMTLVFATVSGYRLEGIQKAVRAARWAYQQNYQIPAPPPVPEMIVHNNLDRTSQIEWDDRSESDAAFDGYKIWRSVSRDTTAYLYGGMRVVDRYQEQSTPGPRPQSLLKPVNPKFDALAKSLAGSSHGNYAPDAWGPWTLVKTIPAGSLASLPSATTPGYRYLWIDSSAAFGSYWYYVSAVGHGLVTGPGGETTSDIETHSVNRNGASGLWMKTYPHAPRNFNFPVTIEGRKNIGAGMTKSSVFPGPLLGFGSVVVGSSSDVEIRVRNTSDDTLHADLTPDNASFSTMPAAVTIRPRDSVAIIIRFSPSSPIVESGWIRVLRDSSLPYDSLRVIGTGKTGLQTGWKPTAGPFGGMIQSFASIGLSLFAGTSGGVYRSVDGGLTWYPVNEGLQHRDVRALAATGSALYAGTPGGVYQSMDNGATWARSIAGLTDTLVTALVANPLAVYAGTSYGVFRSSVGTAWAAMNSGLTTPHVYALLLQGTTIIAGTEGGIYYTSTSSSTWSTASTPGYSAARCLAANGTVMFAGNGSTSVLRSTDGGVHWADFSMALPTMDNLYAIAIKDSTVFIGTGGGGVYASSTTTSAWTPARTGMGSAYVQAMFAASDVIVAGARDGLYRSVNNGTLWSQSNTGLGATTVLSLIGRQDTLIAGAHAAGVARTGNSGTDWMQLTQGFSDDRAIYGILRQDGILYACDFKHGVYVSTDDGQSWNAAINGLTNIHVSSIAGDSGTVWVGTEGNGVFRSTNAGGAWVATAAGLESAYVHSLLKMGGNLFAGTVAGVYRSSNRGATWEPSLTGIPKVSTMSLASSGTTLIAGTYGGAYASTDGGTTWNNASNGLTGPPVWALCAHPAGLFAGTESGVYYSSNKGASWQGISDGLPPLPVYSLYGNNTMIFAGTSGNGVWNRPLSEFVTGITPDDATLPAEARLDQNYPNPFNPSTTVRFSLPDRRPVLLTVFNNLGQLVMTVVNGIADAGMHEVVIDGGRLPSGVYFYRLQAGAFMQTRSMVLIR